jgi:hypothetical protein
MILVMFFNDKRKIVRDYNVSPEFWNKKPLLPFPKPKV